VNRTIFSPLVLAAYERETWEVRGRAAEILAAVGAAKLRRIAVFRAARWADSSSRKYQDHPHFADLDWIRAAEWWRIGCDINE
jgi:hypothetical protein